ncbi:MAG: cobalamin biosynthesis protein, partial [Crocosphaera sp.]
WSECIYAAILGVQLGGKNTYQGVIKEKPLLGDPLNPITPQTIENALNLTRTCCLLWLGLGIGGLWLLSLTR